MLKNADHDYFLNFKTTLRKIFLVTGETGTRNLHVRVCGSKTDMCCSVIFSALSAIICIFVVFLHYNNELMSNVVAANINYSK